ncbi:recQ-mediated genome instability protein 1-like [Melia azedarach]|uniref:RecQ-mediated genome instability protein 1-like n=1 Tax=Melia azedarach TaxID=155640 RepID=A0ACC1Z028_MELAZ|nr:recQ-mediated genome instability protein 1-like [Melia azedarach]
MPRRRLRIHYSSESEEEEEEPNQQQQIFNLPQNNEQSSTVTLPPVNLSPPNPNPNSNLNSDPVPIAVDDDDEDYFTPSPPEVPSGFSISDSLLRLGLSLSRVWLDSCIQGLESSVPGFSELDVAVKAKLCFQQFLSSDMNYCGAGVLPANVHSMHMVDLKGPFVLQVDEIVNISCPLRGRYQDAHSGIKRCLKLSMTDGVQRVFGMEYRPIKDLKVFAPAGLKVVICNVHIRRGLLMLVPEAIEVLGGMVQELDTARRRLVDEVNKPPRGKRTRTGVIPPLATRATLAAWPSNGIHATEPPNNLPSQNVTAFQENEQGATSVASGITISQRTTVFPVSVENVLSNQSSTVMDNEEMQIDAVSISRDNAMFNSSTNVVLDVEDTNMVDEVEHPLILSGDREIPFTYLASLSAKWAATKGKAPSVQGKIKCFLTGVKRFQYKRRETYELFVYVDDGSLISEILIDHNVVQKGIGYSPQDVTAALSSTDVKKVSDMKEIFRQFQLFLANFEGTMLIEMNETTPHPIALEITQGCPSSDAWLLLGRLNSPPANAQTPPCSPTGRPTETIDISP